LDTTYSDRVMLKEREIKVGTIKKVKVENEWRKSSCVKSERRTTSPR
jgi:hypothetical protein